MIRILQVVNAMDRGGAESMVMNLYRNFNRGEIQFDFTNHKGKKAAFDEEIESLGGRILYLPKFKGYNYVTYIKSWKNILKQHPEYKIIHIHNYNIAGIVSMVARQMGVPVIITHSHSTRLNMPLIKKQIFYLFYRSLLKNSTHRFACGKNAGKFLFGNRDFSIVPNAIDVEKYKYNESARVKLRTILGIERNVKTYGHVGTFRTPKNHSFLIDLFAELSEIEPESKLILIGSGELLEKIKSQVNEYGLASSVIFLGQQSNVNEWLSAFDIFLLPSLWEGFPVSIVEAQCAGLPCVVSNVIDKTVNITGNVSFLSLKEDLKYWAETIHSISLPNRIEMASKISESNFEINKATDWMYNFYRNVFSLN